jgi:hypothetical protein
MRNFLLALSLTVHPAVVGGFFFGRLNPAFREMTYRQLIERYNSVIEKLDRVLNSRQRKDRARGIEWLRETNRIRKEMSVRFRWMLISDILGKPLPSGKTYDFIDPPQDIKMRSLGTLARD